MVMSILIPELNVKPRNTKDAVISILTIDWPLSLRGIFYKIKKLYGYSSSYQAVYKAVKELCEMSVLIEKDKKYEIDVGWIKKLQSFTDIVETNYYAKERIQNLSGIKESKQKGDIMVLNFESIFDAEKYLYYFMKSELLKKNHDSVCFQMNSEWRPIYYLRAEYNYYKKFMARGHKFYFVCSGNSSLERECEKFYRAIGINYKITGQEITNDVVVFGDYFLNIFIPEEMKIKIRKMLNQEDTLGMLKEVLDRKSNIRMVITKDKALANEIKAQILRKFKS
ncbi:MAG: hypothetical protein NTZ83_03255 [Candidatus Pacearchaeota archaeon]|nr:hypothetical protein [Candidatus Pacearchaeota archaeon]